MSKAEKSTSTIDAAKLADRLVRSSGVVVVDGLSAGRILRTTSSLRDELYQKGSLLFVLDPHSADEAEQSLDGVIRAYQVEIDRRIGLSDEALRLSDALGARSRGLLSKQSNRAVRLESMGRLWTILSRDLPSILLVANWADLSASDQAALEWMTGNVFSDPIGRLSPEAGAWEVADGAIVFAPEAPDFAPDSITVIDYRAETEQAVRQLLATDEIVRTFTEATRGDVDELAKLVERLPESTTPIRLLAAMRLDADVRVVLQLAAVAGEPVTPDLLSDACERLVGTTYFSRAIRSLCSEGFLRRTMGSGSVLVHVDDRGLASGLVEEMADDVAAGMHSALADAAMASDELAAGFIARHLFGAARFEEAVAFSLRAAQSDMDVDALEDARTHFEFVLEHGDQPRQVEAHSGLIDVFTASGEVERALQHCDALYELLPEANQPRLAVQTGRLLATFGKQDEAAKLFRETLELDLDSDVRFQAQSGLAETLYSSASYDDAKRVAEDAVVELEELTRSSNERTLHLTAMELRNLLGKVAIFQDRLGDAESLFERNVAEASRWAWDQELSRAKANLGIVAMQRGDDEASLERLLGALQSVGVAGGLPRAYCLINLATLFQKADRYVEALDHCLEGLRCAKRISDRLAYRSAANNLASIYHDLGAFDRAWAIFDDLENVEDEGVDLFSQHVAQLAKANLLLAQGDAASAADLFDGLTDERCPRFVADQADVRLTEASVDLEQWDAVRSRIENVERSDAWAHHWTSHEAALALHDGRAEDAADLARRALESLPKTAAVRARAIRVAALRQLGRTEEAKALLADGVRSLLASLDRIPESFHESYTAKPAHRRLLEDAKAAGVPLSAKVASWMNRDGAAPAAASTSEFRAWRERYAAIVGEDARMHQIFRMVDRVAASDATVLIHGESGTGKELIAAAVHRQSDRERKPFVKVNCAAFVENLLLSELFGHEKGAFTGAVTQKDGRFTLADGGTIFLDEIGDISPNTQVALLRVLQEGTFERVGGSQTQNVDVRVVCATNKNLEELVERGEFRLDLYYRLKGVVLETPALRNRREDIPRLVRHFAAEYARSGQTPEFAPAVHQFLASYSWPGNVRELQNFVKSVLLFADGDYVSMEQIEDFREFFSSGTIDRSLPPVDLAGDFDPPELVEVAANTEIIESVEDAEEALVEQLVAAGGSLADLKKRIEMECIRRALIETEGNVTRAAEILQMKRPRLSQIINGSDELAALKQQLVS